MTTLTSCPYCGEPLERGELRSRGGLYFLPDGAATPALYSAKSMEKRGAIPLPPHPVLGGAPPTAYLCRRCRRIILPYAPGPEDA